MSSWKSLFDNSKITKNILKRSDNNSKHCFTPYCAVTYITTLCKDDNRKWFTVENRCGAKRTSVAALSLAACCRLFENWLPEDATAKAAFVLFPLTSRWTRRATFRWHYSKLIAGRSESRCWACPRRWYGTICAQEAQICHASWLPRRIHYFWSYRIETGMLILEYWKGKKNGLSAVLYKAKHFAKNCLCTEEVSATKSARRNIDLAIYLVYLISEGVDKHYMLKYVLNEIYQPSRYWVYSF